MLKRFFDTSTLLPYIHVYLGNHTLEKVVKPVEFRDFFYIDAPLLESYFAQLPPETQVDYGKDLLRTDVKFEASLTPKVITERHRPLLPGSREVALVLFMERYMKANFTFGDASALMHQFISDAFCIRYVRIQAQAGDSILACFPNEGLNQRLRRSKKAFIILGDSSKCFHALGRPKQHSDDSALRKLYEFMCEVRVIGAGNAEVDFRWFGGGRDDLFGALSNIGAYFHRRSFPPVQLKGILRVRERLIHRGQELVVLYPLFLERIEQVVDAPGRKM